MKIQSGLKRLKEMNITIKLIFLMIASTSAKNALGQEVVAPSNSSTDSHLMEGRAFFDGLGKSYAMAESMEVKQQTIENVSCYWFTPKKPLQNKVIIYLHGGAFSWGSIRSHQALVSHIAKETGIKILFVEYALAPEHPYPRGVMDLINVYRSVIADLPLCEIFLMGDSAGGGLIVSSVHRMQRDMIQLPDGVVLISPWLNLGLNTPSYTNNASLDPVLTVESLRQFARAYNPGSLAEADVSSLEFDHFPPVVILVGTNEILQDDSQNFFHRIRKVQPESTFYVFPGQTHVWMLTEIDSPDSKRALSYVKTFLTGTSR